MLGVRVEEDMASWVNDNSTMRVPDGSAWFLPPACNNFPSVGTDVDGIGDCRCCLLTSWALPG